MVFGEDHSNVMLLNIGCLQTGHVNREIRPISYQYLRGINWAEVASAPEA